MTREMTENLENLDKYMSTEGNIELINSNSNREVTWDILEQQCLYRAVDGMYMIGDRNYYSVSNEGAANWLVRHAYPLPKELESEELRGLMYELGGEG